MTIEDHHTLGSLPPFRGLEQVAGHFGVDFELRGSAASRLAMWLEVRREAPDLVTLAPFNTVVELSHTGDASQSAALLEAIDALVPQAPWCRIRLKTSDADRRSRAPRRLIAKLPIREVSFSTARGPDGVDAFVADVAARRVSISVREDDFAPRPRFLEEALFGLLDGVLAYLDLQQIAGAAAISDEAVRRAVTRFLAEGGAESLQDNGGAQHRLREIATEALVRGALASDAGRSVLEAAARALNGPLVGLHEGAVLLTSAEGAAPRPAAASLRFADSLEGAEDVYRRLEEQGFELDPAFSLGPVSEPFDVGPRPSGPRPKGREFLHLAWRTDEPLPGHAGGMLLREDGAPLLPLSVGGEFPGNVRWLRVEAPDDVGALRNVRICALENDVREPPRSASLQPLDVGGPGEVERRPPAQADWARDDDYVDLLEIVDAALPEEEDSETEPYPYRSLLSAPQRRLRLTPNRNEEAEES
jgi:hypothetical protein